MKGGRRQGRERKRREDNITEMDRPGVRQVPEGSVEQGKMEETRKGLKERFLIRRNGTKRANFRGSPLFQATYKTTTTTTGKQTLIQLILCQLELGRLAEGKGHETDSGIFFFLLYVA